MMGLGGILGILLIAVIVWAVIQFTNRNNPKNIFTSNQQKPSGNAENTMDILNKRYARGDIDKEEFERIKKRIS